MAAFPNVDRDAIVAKLHQLSAQMPQEPEPSFWAQIRSVFQQPAVLGTSLAFGAILMMLMVKPPEEGPITDIGPIRSAPKDRVSRFLKIPMTQWKFSPTAARYKPETNSGSRSSPGKELRSWSSAKRLAAEKLYMVFPMAAKYLPSIHGFTRGILPGTIELDQSTGKEKLYLISCEHPFGLSNIEPNIDDIIVPKRCVISSFEINKVKP